MKQKSLKEHLKTIQPKGGKALYKKVGRAGMRKLAKRRWSKKAEKIIKK